MRSASYGGRAATPNLDALASRGARFDVRARARGRHLPSHASILSGRYPYEHGIRDNTGYRFDAARADDRHAAQGAGVCDRRVHRRVSARSTLRSGTGFDIYDDRLDPASASDPGERERRADAVVASATKWIGGQQGQVARVGARLRSAHDLRAACRVGGSISRRAVSRRSRMDRRCARSTARPARHATAAIRSSSSRPIMARRSASTARRRTASSPMSRRCACR